MTFLKNLKIKVEQFFEFVFFYYFRKIRISQEAIPAKEISVRTWEGENDIIGAMFLKVEHMIFNLRKYGSTANLYFDAAIVDKYGDERDKELFGDYWCRNISFEELKEYSPALREQVRGKFVQIKSLLQLRRYLKKLYSLEWYDDNYKNERKELYHKINDILIDKGESLWD